VKTTYAGQIVTLGEIGVAEPNLMNPLPNQLIGLASIVSTVSSSPEGSGAEPGRKRMSMLSKLT